MRIQGTFKPPALAATTRPVDVAGPGFMLIQDDGLRVAGHRPRSSARAKVFLLTLTIGLAAAIAMDVTVGVSMKWTVVLAVTGSAVAAMRGSSEHELDTVEFTVPWRSVAKVTRYAREPSVLMIRLKGFKPSGDIYFDPGPQGEALVDALIERGVRSGTLAAMNA
jgi:hypothetical protein